MATKHHRRIKVIPKIVEIIEVETDEDDILLAAQQAEIAFAQDMATKGKGIPTLEQALLLFVNLVRSVLIGEVRTDADEEEIAAILDVLLDEPGHPFSTALFPYSREDILEAILQEGGEGEEEGGRHQ